MNVHICFWLVPGLKGMPCESNQWCYILFILVSLSKIVQIVSYIKTNTQGLCELCSRYQKVKIGLACLILLHMVHSMWPFILDICKKQKKICWKFFYLCCMRKCRVCSLLRRLGWRWPVSKFTLGPWCKHQFGIRQGLYLKLEVCVWAKNMHLVGNT